MGRQWSMAAVRIALYILLAATGVAVVSAQSVTYTETYWQHDAATPGDWFDLSNWTNGLPETGYHYSYVNNGGTARIADGNAFGGNRLYLGYDSTESGTIELSGSGQFSAYREHVGWNGTGRFIQTGGTNTISDRIHLGYNTGGNGTYELGGTGQLSAVGEYIGRNGTGRFEQTGGLNTARYLYINAKSQYLLTGGALQISDGGGLNLEGTLDFGERAVGVDAGENTFLNLSRGNILGASQASLRVGSNSLTVFPAGSDPNTLLASFSTHGTAHVAGNELVVLPGENLTLVGAIDDRVRCEGTINTPLGRGLDLYGGVTVSDAGNIDLGMRFWLSGTSFGGKLVVNDDAS